MPQVNKVLLQCSNFYISLLFTMDIKGLYTNIPNEYGLNALKYFLEKTHPPTLTLLRLAELVLTQNCFKFGDNYYSQLVWLWGSRKLKSLKHMMVLSLSFTEDILRIFWVQLQCLEKILIDLLILSAISTHPFNILSQFLK